MTVRDTTTQILLVVAVAANGTASAQEFDPLAESNYRYVGSASCAAAACHGGARLTEGRSFAAYQIWVRKDPHARAYEVLSDPQSVRMMKLLYPQQTDSPRRATEDRTCLACHATGVEFQSTTPISRNELTLASDGVSCEACHGAAKDWIGPHREQQWKYRPLSEKQQLGFVETENDLSGRAQMCVECHVGAPGRDVNHDLIAAGHPRLDFELSTFHAKLPKHWDWNRTTQSGEVHIERIEEKAAFEAQEWMVGQLVSARASLRLLDHRTKGTWPELAEYSCYACHHDLRNRNWRSWDRGSTGEFEWGTWHFGNVSTIQKFLRPTGESDSVGHLRKLMRRPFPTPSEVRAHSTALESQLTVMIDRAASFEIGPSQYTQLTLDLINNSLKNGALRQSWDQAAQLYLGVVALSLAGQRSYLDSSVYSAINEDLEFIRQQLLFTDQHNSPVSYAPPQIEMIQQKLRAIEERLQVPTK